MLDLYLNTPDKALNETPLHFAAKYGAYDVVLVFVQYPQLQLHVKNKYGQTPKDVSIINSVVSRRIFRFFLLCIFYVRRSLVKWRTPVIRILRLVIYTNFWMSYILFQFGDLMTK